MKIDVSGHVVPAKQESTFSRHITKQEQTNKAKIGIFKSLTNQRILQENYLINDAHFLINYPNEQKAKSDNFLTFEEVDDSCSNEMVLKMFDSFSTFLKRFNNNQLDRIKHELRASISQGRINHINFYRKVLKQRQNINNDRRIWIKNNLLVCDRNLSNIKISTCETKSKQEKSSDIIQMTKIIKYLSTAIKQAHHLKNKHILRQVLNYRIGTCFSIGDEE